MQDMFKINTKVQAALEKLFQQHRLVFWYDEKAEMTGLFNSLQIPEVEKVVIENNEFTLKHQLLIERPTQHFLLYQAKAKPIDNENWLLDLLLSNYEFHTEASSLYLQDLDLPQEFKSLVQQHEEFFANEKRINDLKALLEPEDRESKIRLKMLSIICATEPEWEKVLYALFAEAYKNKQDKYKAIDKFGLRVFLWETIEKKYNYKSSTPTIKDCLLQLVQDNFERSISTGKPALNKEAYLFVNRWKENTKARQVYYDWSQQLEKDLGIEAAIQNLNAEQLLDADTYAVIDKKVIIGIREHIVNNTSSNYTLQEWIEKRRVKFFFADFSQIYEALSNAASLLDEIRKVNLTIQSAEHQNILKDLTLQIEKAYGNSFLLKLCDNWQTAIDGMSNWNLEKTINQKQFYQQWVEPYKKDNRVFVIISDALRFESATELRERILQEDRYTATLNAVLGLIAFLYSIRHGFFIAKYCLTFEEKQT
jgi:hypothetical protein